MTANLYLPKGAKGPRPGVIGSWGTRRAARSRRTSHSRRARAGYVVLIFDPIGQGERLQYGHVEKEHRPGVGVGEHSSRETSSSLVGEFFGSWARVGWHPRARLSALTAGGRSKHVGITGNSGGGTMTTWLCGLDSRCTMAAPACFVTTMRRNLENELPQDTEQCPPHALALGLDHADFLAAMAPKPVIILAKERDYFDVRGSEEAYARLKRLYALLGAEENVQLHIGPTGHGYTIENREAMYRWFNKVTGISDAMIEPKLTIEKDETLWCAPKGQVAELKSRTVFSFTDENAERMNASNNRNQTLHAFSPHPLRKGSRISILRAAANRKYPKPPRPMRSD